MPATTGSTERLAGAYGRAIDKAGRVRSSADDLLSVTTDAEAKWAAEAFPAAVRALPPAG